MSTQSEVQLTRSDFENLLRNLSGTTMDTNLAGVRVSEAYSQLIEEPDVSVFFNEAGLQKGSSRLPLLNNHNNDKLDKIKKINKPSSAVNNDKDQAPRPATSATIPLHTSTPLHPKYPHVNDQNRILLGNDKATSKFRRPLKNPGSRGSLRSGSLDAHPNNVAFDQDNEYEPPDFANNGGSKKKTISLGGDEDRMDHGLPLHHRRSHKDIRLIQEQEEQINFYEQNASVLDSQRGELESKLTVYQQQLKELQDNDSRRLKHIEEIEHELENTQNELHERRMKQNEELRKARDAATALEEKLARESQKDNVMRKNRLGDAIKLVETEDKAVSPPQLGSPLLAALSSPTRRQVPLEDWSDVSIRLEKLEGEKKSYQGVLNSMEEERSSYLSEISELKQQLAGLQLEISSLKASTDENHHQFQLQSQALHEENGNNALLRQGVENSMSLMMDLAPDSIFQKIIPMIAEQRQYIKELLDGKTSYVTETDIDGDYGSTSSSSSSTLTTDRKREQGSTAASLSLSILSSKGVSVAIGAVGLCILGTLLSETLGTTAGSTGSVSDVLWWQRYGTTIETWGATLDGWVRPKNQHIPS